jgi:hypothetical protein
MSKPKRKLRIKNFENYQDVSNVKNWIKLYTKLLDDAEFHRLDDNVKFQFIALLLLASRTNNQFPNDPELLSELLGLEQKVNVKRLLNLNYLEFV